MNTFKIQSMTQVDNGAGGFDEYWETINKVEGYLDMLSGTDLNSVQNAITEESTHLLIIPQYTEWIDDNMRIVDKDNRYYMITYADNPMGMDHHNEIYCVYGGVMNE